MIDRVVVHRGRHRDSVSLMLASREAGAAEGVEEVSAVSATPINLELLRRSGFAFEEAAEPRPGDMVIAIRARDDDAVEAAIAAFESALAASTPERKGALPPAPTITAAARRSRDANLAVVSVPGPAAASECAAALAAELNVFCFSSGFDHATERELKRMALERDLLMMGPDCGTAILGGVGIGFSNAVQPGPVGIVGASGTGMQQVSCLLDAAGVGISHAIGVGGRDLEAPIGGAMALRAIELLAADEQTRVIVVIAKSPDESVAAAVAERLAAASKPAVVCFPGFRGELAEVAAAETLEDAARMAAGEAGAALPAEEDSPPPSRTGLVRGLFCGGTLRDEAAAVLADILPEAPALLSRESEPGEERNTLVDYGSEELTLGRPHPMIDPSLRDAGVEREGRDERVAVLLADVVLGRGSHPDPASGLAAALERARAARSDPPAAVVSLCGAAGDEQGLEEGAAKLREAGAVVVRSNAAAARLAGGVVADAAEVHG